MMDFPQTATFMAADVEPFLGQRTRVTFKGIAIKFCNTAPHNVRIWKRRAKLADPRTLS